MRSTSKSPQIELHIHEASTSHICFSDGSKQRTAWMLNPDTHI